MFIREFETCELSKSFVNVEIINYNRSHYTVGILGVYLQLGESQHSLFFFFNAYDVFIEIETLVLYLGIQKTEVLEQNEVSYDPILVFTRS